RDCSSDVCSSDLADVHALGETASVGTDASLVLRDGGLEPRNLVAALEGVHGAIDVLDGDLEIDVEQAHVVGGGVVLELLLVLADERGEGLLDSLRGLRSEEHTSELQSRFELVCRLLLEKKK